MHVSPGAVTIANLRLCEIMRAAFGMSIFQIDGPDWLKFEKYDVVAKTEATIQSKALMRMLQTLLVDRLSLVFHRETRDSAVYALVVGKAGVKFPRLTGDSTSHSIRTLPALAEILSNFTDLPVLDKTGLEGQFELNFSLKPQPGGSPENPLLEAAFAATEKLGLELRLQKAPIEFLVIDHIEKTPSGQ